MKLKSTLLTVMLMAVLHPVVAVEVQPETDAEFDQRMEWFTDAQFGLFIHYGVYSVLGGEWNGEPVNGYAEWIQRWGKITPEEYIPLAAQFSPDALDADAWVKRAKDAGMKYMVITTKHHEGFCLWDSAYTEYDLGEATVFDRDILGELKVACDKYGVQFGTYYSIIDWHHPSQRAQQALNKTPMNDKEGYVTYMKAQLKELIDRYDPAIMWFDGDWTPWWTMDDGVDLYNYLRELSPDMIINNRVAKRNEFKKDYGTPENFTPGAALDHVWESCWTVNHSWGFKKSDTTWKSNEVLVQKLIDINAKGGNLLLNVGPQADGSWPEASIGQLAEMGRWNSAHQEAVYGTEFVAVAEPEWGCMTQSKSSTAESGELFGYVFKWPEDGELRVRGVSAGTVEVSTYDGIPLPSQLVKDDIVVDLSSVQPTDYATVLRFNYSGGLKLSEVSYDLELEGDELILKAADATLSGKTLRLQDGIAVGWKGGADSASWNMDVIAPGKFAVKIFCDYGFRRDTGVTLTVGDQELKATLSGKTTNGMKLVELGEIELDDVGNTACTLQFAGFPKRSRLSLKTLYLVPINH
ncbi:alpha-L-fucosidase [Pontiellaceae bacterium B1224]|nr:alpha-L-fucosidase [Pontiellaceae bacterium B1224]